MKYITLKMQAIAENEQRFFELILWWLKSRNFLPGIVLFGSGAQKNRVIKISILNTLHFELTHIFRNIVCKNFLIHFFYEKITWNSWKHNFLIKTVKIGLESKIYKKKFLTFFLSRNTRKNIFDVWSFCPYSAKTALQAIYEIIFMAEKSTTLKTLTAAIASRIAPQAPIELDIWTGTLLFRVINLKASNLISTILFNSAISGASGKDATKMVQKPNWIAISRYSSNK